ncbi:serine/threonine protein kinase [Melittangium boletus]|uniref:Serine/threonine protein kinase n=1 Tax=Melittangium boletus DSM 14713 TaxID=1294270 RepID=A0A250ILW0_9BACT|nr:serine/threonine-protein kinase [Melittangium boletus]ATB32171.1 serine/threonine protein kinase [Melittangium boletus DSM 14713]
MPPATPRTPVPFGQYKLLERLAVGGMAEVFLANQPGPDGFEKPVVIKRIRPHLSKQPAFVRMFLNEARLAAQLNHPNIVQIHDLGKVGESYYIGMEYLFGRDTRRVVPKAESLGISFPMVYALKIASSVCEGLYYAHQKVDLYGSPLNIVHRDVTPENIFVCFDGTVKVLDFGIAKAANRAEQTTRAGELRGKLSYLSPEQCLGKPVDHRSDLFSLGAVLYEWLTGFKLFTGESDVAVMRSIVDGKVYAPSYFRADIPEPVEAILMKALERDRDKRYPTAWHFQQDLDRFLNAYDFTPTNLHLSNFLKQVFLDELEEEQQRMRAPAEPEPAVAPPPPTLDLELPPDDADSAPSGGERIVPVSVTAAQLETLEALARKHHVPVGRMVGELLTAWLKYR